MRSLVCALSLLLCVGCGGLRFDVGQDLPEQRVAGSPLGGLLSGVLPGVAIPLNIDVRAETEKRNTGPARHVYMKSLTLRTTPAAMPSGTFDFLDEIRLFVGPRQGGSLPQSEVGRLVPVPKGQTRIEVPPLPDVDLLPYLNAGAQITATARGSQPPKDITFDGRIEVTIVI
jgi:hypothetical protein